MITIIHGDDIATSRNKLHELLSGESLHTRLDAKNADTGEILNALAGQELFSSKRTIIIENALVATKASKLAKDINDYHADPDVQIVFWQAEVVDKKILTLFPKAKTQSFTLPKNFYLFLDNFMPHKANILHGFLFSMYPQTSAEQVFYALIRRLRQLVMIKNAAGTEFKELASMAPWQLSKLRKQASVWSSEKLLAFYKKLFDLEFRLKTSNLPMPFISHLDILLLQELN